MGRIAYVNGRYLGHGDAAVSIDDRGYQFADGVYEVIAVQGGRPVDVEPHFARLQRSLAALGIDWPVGRRALAMIVAEVIRRNRIAGSGMAYIQITRGVAPRGHAIPAGLRPSLVVTARPLPPFERAAARQGVAVITIPDLRWRRCDVKSIGLLANVLGKQQAVDAGAYEAWMVGADGTVTEGTSTNAWIVTRRGDLVTREAGPAILDGITRRVVLAIAAEQGIAIVERPFTVGEAKAAAEAFVTGTTTTLRPVVRIDDATIGGGGIGPLTERLLDRYAEHFVRPRAGRP
ncbi:MAG: D-amino-acid transaminase [Rhodospirillales bacterium]